MEATLSEGIFAIHTRRARWGVKFDPERVLIKKIYGDQNQAIVVLKTGKTKVVKVGALTPCT